VWKNYDVKWDAPRLTVGAFKALLYIVRTLDAFVIFRHKLIMPWSPKLVKTDFKNYFFNDLKIFNR